MTTSKSTATTSILTVHASKIHGDGVFATREISSGEIMFCTTDFDVLSQAARGTVQRRTMEHILEPQILRWVNHSCQRNAEVRFVGDTAQLIALKEIQLGEEVVCDYYHTEDSMPTPFRCNCGHCTGVMIG